MEMLLALVVTAAVLLITYWRIRRRRGGVPVPATLLRIETEDPEPENSSGTAFYLTYGFPWQGRTLERRMGPRRGILPPAPGQRRTILYDPRRDRVRLPPAPGGCLLLPAAAAILVTAAAGAAALYGGGASASLAMVGMIAAIVLFCLAVLPWQARRRFRRRLRDGALQPVRAVFRQYERREDGEGNVVLSPVFACVWNGGMQRIDGVHWGRVRGLEPGSAVTLYRDVHTDLVFLEPKPPSPAVTAAASAALLADLVLCLWQIFGTPQA